MPGRTGRPAHRERERRSAQPYGAWHEEVAIARIFSLLAGDWFEVEFRGDRRLRPYESRKFMTALLLGLYAADIENRRLSIGEACEMMGAENGRTCQRYIEIAVDRKYLTTTKASDDKRRTELVVTPTLRDVVRTELANFLTEERLFTAAALEVPFPSGGGLPEFECTVPADPTTYNPYLENARLPPERTTPRLRAGRGR